MHNIPISQIKGVLFVPAGRCRDRDRVQLVEDGSGTTYHIYGIKVEEDAGTDSLAVSNNYIAIILLHRDQTDKSILSRLDWIK